MSRLLLLLYFTLSLFGQAPLVIPFRLATPELPFVLIDIKINASSSLTAILDTGQGLAPIIVNQAQARGLGVNYKESDRIAGSVGTNSGAPSIYRAQALTLRLGALTLSETASGVSSALEPVGRALGQLITANIGYLFLKNYTLSLNYKARTMSLSRQPLLKAQSFMVGPKKPLAIVEGRINGLGPYRLAIDTGATNSVLSRTLAEHLLLPRGIPVPVLRASGTSNAYMTTVRVLEVAGRRFNEFSFAAVDFMDELTQAAGTSIDGVLGANAFQNLLLSIDYPNQRLSLNSP